MDLLTDRQHVELTMTVVDGQAGVDLTMEFDGQTRVVLFQPSTMH